FFSSRRRHTRFSRDWSSDVCSSDLLLGDYYTKGTFALNAQSQYRKRYKYNGNFNLRYENIVEGERGFDDYMDAKIYNIQWSHSRSEERRVGKECRPQCAH